MVLCGHPQLESNLRLAINEALAQRLVLRVRLRSLQAEEVDGYLRFRLPCPKPRRRSRAPRGASRGSSTGSPNTAC